MRVYSKYSTVNCQVLTHLCLNLTPPHTEICRAVGAWQSISVLIAFKQFLNAAFKKVARPGGASLLAFKPANRFPHNVNR